MSTTSLTISIPVPGPRVRWAAAGLATGLLVATIAGPLLSPRPILALDPPPGGQHTISVSGMGRVLLSPDIADLRLGVTITAATVEAARAGNAAAMTAVIASLKANGIVDRDIQTTILSLSPVYDWAANTTPPKLIGYTLTNTIAVTIRDLDAVGEAIDDALDAGATSLDSISFRVEDQTAAETRAREAAMADAKAKAKTLASAAGVAIVGVVSISESVAPVPYPIYYGEMAGAAARDASTPVQAGTNEVSVTVSVTYLIG